MFKVSFVGVLTQTPKLPSYRSQSIDLLCKLIYWFLYDGNFGVKWGSWKCNFLHKGRNYDLSNMLYTNLFLIVLCSCDGPRWYYDSNALLVLSLISVHPLKFVFFPGLILTATSSKKWKLLKIKSLYRNLIFLIFY